MRCICCNAHSFSHAEIAMHSSFATRGVRPPVACGLLVSWWRRLLRGCRKRKRAHSHLHCNSCGARWVHGDEAIPSDAYQEAFGAGVAHARKEMRP